MRMIALILLCLCLAPGFAAASGPSAAAASPDLLSSRTVQLTPLERKGLELAREWEANATAPGRVASKVVFVHGAGTPAIIAQPLNVCDVELQAGEELREVVVGDSARWLVDVGTSGKGAAETVHLLIKPVDAGLESSAVVTTSRRVYHLRLISRREGFMPYVGFLYPGQLVQRFRAREAEEKAQKARQKRWKTAEMDGRIVDLSRLDFDYRVSGDAPWKPTQVYDDGRQTFIRLPEASASGETPVLLVRQGDGDVLVNYRVKGRTMVVDGLFKRVVLVVGVGGDQQQVTITREAN